MPLSASDRQTLIGPAVVGAFFGALSALAVAGVHSEYGSHMQSLYPGVTSLVAEALLTFAIVTLGSVALFGVVPLLLKRVTSKQARGPDA
jgi:hypothetical protein